MRPDYCPQANEPCQAMCEKPCAPIGRLKVEKLEPLTEDELWQDKTIMSLNAAMALPLVQIGELADAITAAHNAKLGNK